MQPVTFSADYHQARSDFMEEVQQFASARGLTPAWGRLVVDEALDLTVDTVWLGPAQVERLFICVSGIHGLEGYTGSALQRVLLRGHLRGLDMAHTGIWMVHGLNPWGFHFNKRVNRHNIDLNRNFEIEGETLYGADSSGYESLRGVLAPREVWGGSLGETLSFGRGLITALLSQGMSSLRQATLSGQYTQPDGIFYGGASLQPEIEFYRHELVKVVAHTREVLLVDLHTGYGERGLAYPLFPQADSPEVQAWVNEGVRTRSGGDKTYTARGELVRGSYLTCKKRQPDLLFNGMIVEFGTHGLSVVNQIQDLGVVVRENQVRIVGAKTEALATRASSTFTELFAPSDPGWRAQVLQNGQDRVEALLRSRGFL